MNEDLSTILAQLRSTQAELQQKTQELELAQAALVKERQQLQATRDELERRTVERITDLQEREAFLSSIYNGADQAIFVIDVDRVSNFHYVNFNPIAEQYVGMSSQALQGKTPEEAFGPMTGAIFRRNYECCLQVGTSVTYEEQVMLKNRQICTLTTLSPLRNKQGRIYRIVGTAIDITDRKQLEQALQHSEQKYHQILDSIVDMVFVKEPSSRLVWGNRAFRDYYGMTQEKLQGIIDAPFNEPDYTHQYIQDDAFVFTTGQTLVIPEEPVTRHDGVIRLFNTIKAPIYNETGQVILLVGVCRDITDRKQAESALQKSEEQLRLALDLNAIGSWDWHIDTGEERWNANHYRLLGYQPGEIEPSYCHWRDRVHPDDLAQIEQTKSQALQNQTDYEAEYRLILPDGRLRWVLSRGRGLYDQAGKPVRMVGIVFDISDRKQAEIQLREMSMALSNAVEGISRLDQQGRYLSVNEAYAHIVGYTPEEMIGMNWQTTVHEDDLEYLVAGYQQMLRQGKVELEARGIRKDGTVFYKQLFMVTAYNEQQQFTGHYCFMKNISERKQLEAERQRIEAELRQSEQKLRAVFDSTFQFIGVLTPDGRVLDGNRTAFDVVAADRANVIGKPFWETPWWVNYPEQQEQLRQAIARAAGGEFVRMETRHVWADGTQAFVDFSLKPVFDEAGTVVMLIPEGRDITDRKQAELETQKFVCLADNSSELIGMCDMNFVPFYLNPMGKQLMGLEDIQQYSTTLLQEFFFPEDWDFIFQEFFPRVFREGRAEVEIRFRHFKTGEALWMVYSVFHLKDKTGQPIGLGTFSRNITDRKLAEQKIREQAALLDITSDAIFVRDLDQRILYWNQGAERLYGWTAAETIGQPVPDLLQSEMTQIADIMPTLLTQGEWRGEIRKVTKLGQEVMVATRWTLVRDETNQPKFILSVDTDITEKKQLEAQFYRAQRLESLGTLAGGIAHDLNNVLTPIVAISQLLRLRKQTGLDPKSLDMLQILEDSARRGANMVKQILTFTRGTEGDRTPIQVAAPARDVLNVIRQTFPKSISIQEHIPNPAPWLVSADSTHLHQVLMNLCVNARDAMPTGGLLTLTIDHTLVDATLAQRNLDAQVGNYVVVTVADTGTGIPPAVRDRIFEPFFTTKPTGQGTGLGLATVLGIVKNYGGFLEVVSEVGQGTQIQVYLPTIAAGSINSEQECEPFNGEGELVLLVDDDIAVLQSTQSLLESHQYIVLSTHDGLEAIDLYRQHQANIRVVLIDIMMPTISGIDLIQHLRAINPIVKIIAMSGLPANREPALAAGANEFLSKPYELSNLLEKIRTLII